MNEADETAKMFTDERKEPVEKEEKKSTHKKRLIGVITSEDDSGAKEPERRWHSSIAKWWSLSSAQSVEVLCAESRQRQMLCAEPRHRQIKEDGVKF